MGYFVAPLSVFESNIEQHAPHLWENYQALLAQTTAEAFAKEYLDFASEPIDTALIEKVVDLMVTPGTFDWMDLGSFPDVHQVHSQDKEGNAVSGHVELEGVTNSLVRNDMDIPVAVIGLDNIAVISTSNGILVTNKSHAQKVGDVSKRLADKQ